MHVLGVRLDLRLCQNQRGLPDMMAKERANILIEALPYIREYHDQIIVIKYGGNAMIDDELKRAVIQDVLLLRLVGIHVVLVHGGGPDISEMLRKVDIPSRFENGLRVTTKETMEIVQWCCAER